MAVAMKSNAIVAKDQKENELKVRQIVASPACHGF
jgi:predicted transposase YbfD/YdcC